MADRTTGGSDSLPGKTGVLVTFTREELRTLDEMVAQFQRDRSDGRKVSRAQVVKELYSAALLDPESDGSDVVII